MNMDLNFCFGSDDEKENKKKKDNKNKQNNNANKKRFEKKGLSKKYQKRKNKIKNVNFEFQYLIVIVLDKLDNKERKIELNDFLKDLNNLNYDKGKNLIEEDDYGNTEYKLKLIDHSMDRIQHLSSQMKFRLDEGFGEANYNIGYEDNGNALGLNENDLKNSLMSLCYLSNQNQSDLFIKNIKEGTNGKLLQIIIKRRLKDSLKLELRIIMIGSFKAGKSTLLGVLTSGKNDNGKGLARMNVLNHKHEVLTGITSSLTYTNLFFDEKGNVSNKNNKIFNSWEKIIENSSKILTFIDIGGHEKYKKTFIHGCLSTFPDYSMVVLNALKEEEIKNQIEIATALQTKFFIVITHIDLVTNNYMINYLKKVRQLFNENEDYIPIIIRDMEDCVFLSKFVDENIIPIFAISNLNGINVDLLKYFLNLIPVNNESKNNKNLKTEVLIQVKFEKENKTILSGTVIKGNLRKKQILNLGPDLDGNFHLVEVLDIHCYKIPVRNVDCGQSCSVAIKCFNSNLDLSFIKRGTILIESKEKPKANKIIKVRLYDYGKGFDVQLNKNYEPIVYSQTFRQSCEIISHYIEKDNKMIRKKSNSFYIHKINNQEVEEKIKRKESNKSNEKKFINFKTNHYNIFTLRFKFFPEFVINGQKIIIHDDLLRVVGHIISIDNQE